MLSLGDLRRVRTECRDSPSVRPLISAASETPTLTSLLPSDLSFFTTTTTTIIILLLQSLHCNNKRSNLWTNPLLTPKAVLWKILLRKLVLVLAVLIKTNSKRDIDISYMNLPSLCKVDIKRIFLGSLSETFHHTHLVSLPHKDFGRISSSLFYVKTGFFPSDPNFLNPPLSMQIPLSFYLYQYP